MAYTVGIRRRFFPGFRRLFVNGHAWQDGRCILNLTDGSQEHLHSVSLKVYPDFWTHLAQIEQATKAAHIERVIEASNIVARPPPQTMAPPQTIQTVEDGPHEEYVLPPKSPQQLEVERRAADRVRSILELDGAH